MKKNIFILFIFLSLFVYSSVSFAMPVDQNGINMLIGAQNSVELYREYGDVSGLNQAIAQMNLFLSQYTEPSQYVGQAYETLGDAYYLLKNYPQAIKSYGMAVQYLPENSADYEYSVYSLGYSYMESGDSSNAIKYFSMLYTSQTYGDEAKVLVGGIYFNLGQYSQATSVLNTVQSNQWKAWAYYYKGRVNFNLGNYSQAISDFQQVLQYTSDLNVIEPSVYYQSYSYLNSGKIQNAIDTASNALKSYSPTTWTFDLYMILGQSYYENGQYKEAIATFQNASQIQHGTSSYYALNAKAWAEYKMGNYTDAISDWENVLNNSTNLELAFNAGINAGNTLRENKNFNSAVTLYKQMETKFQSYINQINLEEGKTYLESGNYQQATTIFTNLSKLSEPLKDSAIYWLAYTYNLESNYSLAISTLSGLIQTTQSSDTKANAYMLEGDIYAKASQYVNAINAYKNAINFGNQTTKLSAEYNLGLMYYNNSDYKDAINQFSYAINNRITDPNTALNAAYYLSQSYVSLKDYNSAIATYDWIAKYDFQDIYRSSIYVLKAIAMGKLGLYAQIPAYVDSILQAYPNVSTKNDLLYYKANAYMKTNDLSKAFSIATSLSNQNTSNDAKGGILYIEAKYYQSINDIKNTEKYLKDVYMLYPSSSAAPNAAYDLGNLFYSLHDYSNAKDAFFALVSLFPSDQRVPEALYYIGLSYENIGQASNAIQVYNSLVSKFPNSPYSSKAQARLSVLEKR
ncbi:tetratricopeptide repeat protein [Athalassotoga sp.]|uniref:tetratricopeptide repeat protein n=1 Tax=Athalassotoga sp. TaxID=2022597 RepID=UPI003D08FB9C